MFWHKEISMYLHQTLSINIILKSIKGHNSVKKFGKIICIRQYSSQHGTYTCISMHKQNCIKIHQLKNNENLFIIVLSYIFSISMHLQNFTKKILQFVHQILSINKISTSLENFDRNQQINSQDIEHKQNSDVDQGQ